MRKEIYLIRGLSNEDYPAFHQRIAGIVEFVTATHNPEKIKYTITTAAPPGLSIIPFSRKKLAAISVYHPYEMPVHSLMDADGFFGAYLVTEALPVAYVQDWPNGTRTPGACLLTIFSRKKNIDHPTFLNRWHNRHTPLSLRYHPLWNYNRNVVEQIIPNGSASLDAIVEEQVRHPSDLLNPFKFFGNLFVILPRMIHVYLDTKSFIDYPSMQTFLADEYIIK